MHSAKKFSRAFYRSITHGSLRAAECVAPLVQRCLGAGSVVDFGCGTGAWLHAFRTQGAAVVLGLDQFDPASVELLIDASEYRKIDLASEVRLERKYDLALSLEVGEHIPRDASQTLVKNLARASNRVVFSAATPGQGGVNHINERPLADWLHLFAGEGFLASDFVRVRMAELRLSVEPWYRYNTLFFFAESELASLPEFVRQHVVREQAELTRGVPLWWRLRSALLSTLPVAATTFLANCKHNANALLKDLWSRKNY